MRTLFRSLIINHEPLTELIEEDKWLSAGSFSEENVPDRMFAVIRYGTFLPGMAAVRRGTVSLWINDDPGTYTRIDDVLNALTDRLDGVEQVADGQGNEIMKLEWTGNSGDLYDPGYRTITKNCNFNIIGKGL